MEGEKTATRTILLADCPSRDADNWLFNLPEGHHYGVAERGQVASAMLYQLHHQPFEVFVDCRVRFVWLSLVLDMKYIL